MLCRTQKARAGTASALLQPPHTRALGVRRVKNRIIAVLIAGFTIVFIWFAYDVFTAYILGRCDPKFGCEGVIMFRVFVSSIAGSLSSVSYFVVSVLCLRLSITPSLLLTVLVGAIMAPILNLVSRSTMELPVFILAWIILSMFFLAGANYIESLLKTKNT